MILEEIWRDRRSQVGSSMARSLEARCPSYTAQQLCSGSFVLVNKTQEFVVMWKPINTPFQWAKLIDIVMLWSNPQLQKQQV